MNDRIPFTLNFYPHNYAVKSIILNNFKLLQKDPETGKIFSQLPLISFKRDKNVGNFLVRSELKTNMKMCYLHNKNDIHISSGCTCTSRLLCSISKTSVRVSSGFKTRETFETKRPQAEWFYCFRAFGNLMKPEARVFEITSPTKKISLNYHLNKFSQYTIFEFSRLDWI